MEIRGGGVKRGKKLDNVDEVQSCQVELVEFLESFP